MNLQSATVPYDEQVREGVVGVNRYNSSNFVPARSKVLPPVQAIPSVSDPYAPYTPQVQQVIHVDVTPVSRAWAMVMKVSAVTVALATLTLAAMVMLDSFFFFLWLLLASIEWVGAFIVLAVIDYRETPAAQARLHLQRYLDMMEREQVARLRAMYGRELVDG